MQDIPKLKKKKKFNQNVNEERIKKIDADERKHFCSKLGESKAYNKMAG